MTGPIIGGENLEQRTCKNRWICKGQNWLGCGCKIVGDQDITETIEEERTIGDVWSRERWG